MGKEHLPDRTEPSHGQELGLLDHPQHDESRASLIQALTQMLPRQHEAGSILRSGQLCIGKMNAPSGQVKLRFFAAEVCGHVQARLATSMLDRRSNIKELEVGVPEDTHCPCCSCFARTTELCMLGP